MGCCNSYPPCQANNPSTCDPSGVTNDAYQVVVEDVAFCKKTLATPSNVSALQHTINGFVEWKDGSAVNPFSLPQLQGATGSTGYAGIVGVKSNGDFIKISGASIGGSDQPKGGGTNKVFFENDIIVTDNYTITTDKNALTAGPINVASGVTVTVPAGSTWTVV